MAAETDEELHEFLQQSSLFDDDDDDDDDDDEVQASIAPKLISVESNGSTVATVATVSTDGSETYVDVVSSPAATREVFDTSNQGQQQQQSHTRSPANRNMCASEEEEEEEEPPVIRIDTPWTDAKPRTLTTRKAHTKTTFQQKNIVASLPIITEESSVYFQWTSRPATMLWRETILTFSSNRIKYPDWSNEICDQVKKILEQHGVTRFKVCLDKGQPLKQIFDKKKTKCLGNWYDATDDDILKRTRQRFLDDRKPRRTAPSKSEKRPRGRQPKPNLIDSPSPESKAPSASPSHSILANLQQDLAKYRFGFEHDVTVEYGNSGETGRLHGLLLRLKAKQSQHTNEDTAKLLQAAMELERVETDVCNQIETALGNTPALASSQHHLEPPFDLESPFDSESPFDLFNDERASKKCKRSFQEHTNTHVANFIGSASSLERQPSYPVMPKDVCLNWNNHLGTTSWSKVVERFSRNTEAFPEWDDKIYDEVKETLAKDGINHFFAFLDSTGRFCETILDGLWYPATPNEVLEKTREMFLRSRRSFEELKGADQNSGGPSDGGSSSGPFMPEEPGNDDDSSSPTDDENQDMGGHSDSGCSSSMPNSTPFQNNASNLPPVDMVMKITVALEQFRIDKERKAGVVFVTSNELDKESVNPHKAIFEVVDESSIKEESNESKAENADIQQHCPLEHGITQDGEADHNNNLEGDSEKNYTDEIDDSIRVADAEVIPLSVSDETLPLIESPLLTAECSLSTSSIATTSMVESLEPTDDCSIVTVPENQGLRLDGEHCQTVMCGLVLVTPPQDNVPDSRQLLSPQFYVNSQDEIKTNDLTQLDTDTKNPKCELSKEEALTSAMVVANAEKPSTNTPVNSDALTTQKPTDSMVMREENLQTRMETLPRPGAFSIHPSGPSVQRVVGNNQEMTAPPNLTGPIHGPLLPSHLLLVSFCFEMELSGDAFKFVSKKVRNVRWKDMFATLSPNDFAYIITNVKMEYDRPRVAEMLAQLLIKQNGVRFTCQHVALAIRNTSFRATMAERLLPLCVDVSTDISLVQTELQEWDVSLLLISLCRKVQTIAS